MVHRPKTLYNVFVLIVPVSVAKILDCLEASYRAVTYHSDDFDVVDRGSTAVILPQQPS